MFIQFTVACGYTLIQPLNTKTVSGNNTACSSYIFRIHIYVQCKLISDIIFLKLSFWIENVTRWKFGHIRGCYTFILYCLWQKKIEPTYFPQFDKNRYKWFIHGYYIKVGQTQIILEGECCDRHTHISSTIKIIEVMNGLWPTLWSIIKCVVFT